MKLVVCNKLHEMSFPAQFEYSQVLPMQHLEVVNLTVARASDLEYHLLDKKNAHLVN